MNRTHLSPAEAACTAPQGRVALVLGLLAALFVGGLVLASVLTAGDSGRPVTRPPESSQDLSAEQTLTQQSVPRTREVETATRAELEALRAELNAVRNRIDGLSEQTAAFEGTSERIDVVEGKVINALAAAEAALSRADEVAQRPAELTEDYARLGARFTQEGVLIRFDETALGFTPGSSALTAEAHMALAEVADFLQRRPGQLALVRGHTDATGVARANLSLSEARATAVRDALIELGIAPARLRVEGVGAAEPIADNTTSAGRRQNRRVDFLLSTSGSPAG